MSTKIGIVGLGYIGLPQAVAFAAAGNSVVGVDIDQRVVAMLRDQRSPVDTVTDGQLRQVSSGFTVSADIGSVAACETVLICVPTPLDDAGRPDFGPLRAAAAGVAAQLSTGQLVVIESTVGPGATEEMVRPVLESSGLVAGTDFDLVFAPERIDPGNRKFPADAIPKVIGGLTPKAAHRAARLYAEVVPLVHVTRGIREAEAAKTLENAYRQVNIALVHEFSRYCDELGIDAAAAIDAAATKPFGYQAFYPGVGVGGHCIPVDPMYLADAARTAGAPIRLIELAQEINDGWPRWVAERCARQLAGPVAGARVLVLGMTYKPDVADVRNSPSLVLVARLAELGAVVSVHDPLVSTVDVGGVRYVSVPDLPAALAAADLVVVAQMHTEYRALSLRQARLLHIADTRHTDRWPPVPEGN